MYHDMHKTYMERPESVGPESVGPVIIRSCYCCWSQHVRKCKYPDTTLIAAYSRCVKGFARALKGRYCVVQRLRQTVPVNRILRCKGDVENFSMASMILDTPIAFVDSIEGRH